MPGIVVDLVDLTPVRTLERPFGGATAPPHGAELEHAEGLAVETDAVLEITTSWPSVTRSRHQIAAISGARHASIVEATTMSNARLPVRS